MGVVLLLATLCGCGVAIATLCGCGVAIATLCGCGVVVDCMNIEINFH